MRDPEKQRERSRRYLLRKKIEKYGAESAHVDMRGRHSGHAHGASHPRWSGGRRVTDQGYIAVRVPLDHPHAWGPRRLKSFRYAYERRGRGDGGRAGEGRRDRRADARLCPLRRSAYR